MRKWISGKIRKYVSDMALDFTVRWEECRSMMEESVKREDGMVKYGMLGIMATIMMMFAVLGNVIELLVLILMVCGGLFAFFVWLCFLIVHPVWTTVATIAVVAPFSFGCVYCSKMKDRIKEREAMEWCD